jgi:small-conductance mechanosensitive channel
MKSKEHVVDGNKHVILLVGLLVIALLVGIVGYATCLYVVRNCGAEVVDLLCWLVIGTVPK